MDNDIYKVKDGAVVLLSVEQFERMAKCEKDFDELMGLADGMSSLGMSDYGWAQYRERFREWKSKRAGNSGVGKIIGGPLTPTQQEWETTLKKRAGKGE